MFVTEFSSYGEHISCECVLLRIKDWFAFIKS